MGDWFGSQSALVHEAAWDLIHKRALLAENPPRREGTRFRPAQLRRNATKREVPRRGDSIVATLMCIASE